MRRRRHHFFNEIVHPADCNRRARPHQFGAPLLSWLLVDAHGDPIWDWDGDVFSDTLREYGIDLRHYTVTLLLRDDQQRAMADAVDLLTEDEGLFCTGDWDALCAPDHPAWPTAKDLGTCEVTAQDCPGVYIHGDDAHAWLLYPDMCLTTLRRHLQASAPQLGGF